MSFLSNLTISDLAAWCGAGLATIVLGWDIFKWLAEGPKIRIEVQYDMKLIEMDGEGDDQLWLIISISNNGGRATTVNQLYFRYFKNLWQTLRNNPETNFIIKNPGFCHQLPHKLEPGDIWTGRAKQNDEVIRMINDRLYCYVNHSATDKHPCVRVKKKKVVKS